jgi:hypothetical protein
MKIVAVLLPGLMILFFFNCAALFRSSQTNNKSVVLNVKSDSSSAAVDTVAKPCTSNVSTQDIVRAAESQVLVVSPRILFGIWRGKDTMGREVLCAFTEAKTGESSIFNVVVRIGKINVTGNCTDWENNSCQLTLNTKEIQNIYARWLFRYDGMWLTIQTGDQLISGLKTFRLKKNKTL